MQKNVGKYNGGTSKEVYKIVIGGDAPYGSKSNENCLWQNHFEANVGLFLRQKITWRRSILSGAPHRLSSKKFEKRTREDESLFNMTIRALTHRLKPAPF